MYLGPKFPIFSSYGTFYDVLQTNFTVKFANMACLKYQAVTIWPIMCWVRSPSTHLCIAISVICIRPTFNPIYAFNESAFVLEGKWATKRSYSLTYCWRGLRLANASEIRKTSRRMDADYMTTDLYDVVDRPNVTYVTTTIGHFVARASYSCLGLKVPPFSECCRNALRRVLASYDRSKYG